MQDRRQHPRIPCQIQVIVEGLPAPMAMTSRDISHGGVFLFSRAPRALNCELDVTIQAGRDQVRARGLVVHHLAGVGFGVRFLEVSARDRDTLADFLEVHERNAGATLEAAG